jgi:site-specific recombinase XerD
LRGHVRHRGEERSGSWEYIVDVGMHAAQRCPACKKRTWVERRPLASCPKCGGLLKASDERRRAIKSGFATQKECEAAMNKLLVKVEEHNYTAPSKANVREYLTKEWLPAVKATIRPTTYRSYEQHVMCHIAPHIGSVKLQTLSGSQINALYATLAETGKADGKSGLSPRTIHHVHTCLHKACKDAVRWGRLPKNPVEAADPPRGKGEGAAEMKTWTAKQLKAFLESTGGERLRSLYHLLAMTGMRRGEGVGLRWDDVDLEAGRLSVRRALIPYGDGVIVSEPKTAKGRRSIALDPGTIEALKAQAQRQLADQEEWDGVWVDSGYVFTKENGEPYHPQSVSRSFQGALEAAKLPRIRLHDLRHTHATLALQAGVHAKVISERLGHASIAITLDTYSHAIPALQEDAATLIAGLVFAGE